MKTKKTSVVWKINKIELQKIINNSNSLCEVLEKLGLPKYSGNHRTLNRRIEEENIDLNILKKNRDLQRKKHCKSLHKKLRIPDSDVFCKDSKYSNRVEIKKRLINRYNIIYKCSECGNSGTHNNKPLSLQLDHINGVNNDNRIENLRFLCPNCHSQTKTYSGKMHKIYHTCPRCSKPFRNYGKYCPQCTKEIKSKKPTKEILEKLVWEKPTLHLSKDFGVSDVAIAKWCKSYRISKPPRGYWAKQNKKMV
jgi:5-methylcytosine-specific restriction endonuclease McrA